MSITRTVLSIAAPLPKLESFRRCLFIGPHPDDIEIGAGALAAKLAAAGKELCFLICTDGRYGGEHVPHLRPEELAAVRKEEALASAAALGVRDVRFLGFCDGGFYDPGELETAAAREIGSFGPDVIFAPDPNLESECHRDHLNVGRIAANLACFAPYGGIMERFGAKTAEVKAVAFYFTSRPNAFVSTTGYLPRQMEALFSCHKSQFPEGSPAAASLRQYLKLRSVEFGLRAFSRTGEAYRVLDVLRMHCVSEGAK